MSRGGSLRELRSLPLYQWDSRSAQHPVNSSLMNMPNQVSPHSRIGLPNISIWLSGKALAALAQRMLWDC
jgi:hypothetical protein